MNEKELLYEIRDDLKQIKAHLGIGKRNPFECNHEWNYSNDTSGNHMTCRKCGVTNQTSAGGFGA